MQLSSVLPLLLQAALNGVVLVARMRKPKPAPAVVLASDDADYRMQHQAPDAESGAPLHDLTANGIYPKDVYETLEQYRDYGPHDYEALDKVRRYRGKPDARTWIYRAVPKGVKTINPGDWVAIIKGYARTHGKHAHDSAQDMPVLAARVFAREITTAGDSLQEWGYNGKTPLKGTVVFRPRKAATPEQRAARADQRKADARKAQLRRMFPHEKW